MDHALVQGSAKEAVLCVCARRFQTLLPSSVCISDILSWELPKLRLIVAQKLFYVSRGRGFA